jgi:hypothetical protein
MILLPVFILTLIAGWVACDDKEGDGLASINQAAQPAIERLRVLDIDSTIVSATFGEIIAIVGSGLEAVTNVRFNGVEATLNINYITKNLIICSVPDALPEEISNRLEVVTAKGKRAETEFTLELPLPLVTTMYNEYVEPGATASILGKYFFFVESVTFEKSGNAEIVSYTDDEIVIVVPDGATPGERIMVSNTVGNALSDFYYRDESMLLMDFDHPATDWGGSFCWGDLPLSDDESQAVSGLFGTIQGEALGILGDYSSQYLASTCYFDYQFSGLGADYLLKFEINLQETWSIGKLVITINADTDDQHRYEFRPWVGSGATTDGWHTISINLSDFEPAVENLGTITDFRIMFVNDADIPLYNIGIDNFRLSKKSF